MSVRVSLKSSKVNGNNQKHLMSLFVMHILQKICKDHPEHQRDQGLSDKNSID